MTQDRTNRAEQIFLALRELELADQERLLIALCGEDIGLRRAVESMVSAEGPTQTAPTESMAPHPGPDADRGTAMVSQIGHYRIEEQIGEGGMGVVYGEVGHTLFELTASRTESGILPILSPHDWIRFRV